MAICIDWGIALLISNFAFAGDSWATLAVFAVEQILLVGTLGYSIGHRIVSIHVLRLGGGPAGPLAALVRTLLLCLVIPAVIFDPDQRGLHDKAMNTVLVRMYVLPASDGGARLSGRGVPSSFATYGRPAATSWLRFSTNGRQTSPDSGHMRQMGAAMLPGRTEPEVPG